MNDLNAQIKHVKVAVGVIHKDAKFFVCCRQSHQHQGNKWEFPGGKIDAGESVEQALQRELLEEIGISVQSSKALMTINFEYPDKHVSLHVHLVEDFSGHAHGAEGQDSQWVDFSALTQLEFPAANVAIIEKLRAMGF